MAGNGLLIVVPARGGSKGLPRKNARRLAGIPLLAWTSDAVRRADLPNATCVLSTDDPQIADIGRSVGLDVPFLRPAELATDTATAEAVALHALAWLEENRRVQASAVMWLQPTSPFRDPSCLRRAIEIFEGGNCAGVLGVKALHRTMRTLFYSDTDLRLAAVEPAAAPVSRRQDMRALLTPNGALYLVASETLRREKTFFPASCRGLVMSDVASIDIDDAEDWSVAEALAVAGLTWRGSISGNPAI